MLAALDDADRFVTWLHDAGMTRQIRKRFVKKVEADDG